MTTTKLPLVGWLKVFEFNWTVGNQRLEFGQQQEDQHLLDSLTRKDPGLAAEFLRFACWARGVSSTTSMSLSLSSSSSLTTGTSGWNPGFFSVSPAPVWLLEGLEEVTLHCTLSMTRSLEEVTLYCTLSMTRSLEEVTLYCTLSMTRSLEEITLHCTQSMTKSHTPLHTVQLMSKELKSSLSAIMVPFNHNRITNMWITWPILSVTVGLEEEWAFSKNISYNASFWRNAHTHTIPPPPPPPPPPPEKKRERTLICLCLLIITSRAQVTHPIPKPEKYANYGRKHTSVIVYTESRLCLFFLKWVKVNQGKGLFFLLFFLENGALEKCFIIIIITW